MIFTAKTMLLDVFGAPQAKILMVLHSKTHVIDGFFISNLQNFRLRRAKISPKSMTYEFYPPLLEISQKQGGVRISSDCIHDTIEWKIYWIMRTRKIYCVVRQFWHVLLNWKHRCADPWLRRNATCPICKQNLPLIPFFTKQNLQFLLSRFDIYLQLHFLLSIIIFFPFPKQ